MITVNDIKSIINYFIENGTYKLNQWLVDNFGSFCYGSQLLAQGKVDLLAKRLDDHSLETKLELVELMY